MICECMGNEYISTMIYIPSNKNEYTHASHGSLSIRDRDVRVVILVSYDKVCITRQCQMHDYVLLQCA